MYKTYFRKSSFKKDILNANIFISLITKYKPKKFLEVGVLEGVTARNVCEILNNIYGKDFNYIGVDLFGLDIDKNNLKEFTPISKKHSNPFKNFYYKYILRHYPNSVEGVNYLLKKFNKNIKLYKGYSKNILQQIDITNIDFVFLDGGHSYETVKEDLNIILKYLKKDSVLLVDDYNQDSYGVKKAVDECKNNYKHEQIGRFMLIKK
tara:strand:- start:75 stop:695 length:621 start_codon:yes stop_codon:yes gene_type:complete